MVWRSERQIIADDRFGSGLRLLWFAFAEKFNGLHLLFQTGFDFAGLALPRSRICIPGGGDHCAFGEMCGNGRVLPKGAIEVGGDLFGGVAVFGFVPAVEGKGKIDDGSTVL